MLTTLVPRLLPLRGKWVSLRDYRFELENLDLNSYHQVLAATRKIKPVKRILLY